MLRIPVGRQIADSMQSVTHLEFVGLTISTDEGMHGTGYTITVGHGGSVIQKAIDTLFMDELIGSDPHDVRQIWQHLYFGKSHWIGRAGVDDDGPGRGGHCAVGHHREGGAAAAVAVAGRRHGAAFRCTTRMPAG